MHIYIVAIIISVTLIAILFFALRSTVKRIDYNTKKYFVDKLQDYDYLIDEKKKILDELNKKIEENKKILSNEIIEQKQVVNVEKNEYRKSVKLPKFIDEDLFKNYKNIKEKFSFDKEEIINNFIKDISLSKGNDYETLVNIRKKFTSDKIYEIIKLRVKDQLEKIYKTLTKKELEFVEKIINKEKFKISDFITKLDTLIEKNDPVIYIYTGEEDDNFDHISPNIKTEYDENINEGIKISYKGVLHDYSL